MTTQSAALPANNTNNARNWADEKVMTGAWSGIATFGNSSPYEAVIVRWYMSRTADGASPVYCSLWVRGNHPSGMGSISLSGRGRARGYGYHKRSAALQAAIDSAGIKLAEPIDGVGEDACRDACRALVTALGGHTMMIVEHN